ncbi:MAG: hypothetical protein WA813_19215, partial [Beijerinckiaceae bacterium]
TLMSERQSDTADLGALSDLEVSTRQSSHVTVDLRATVRAMANAFLEEELDRTRQVSRCDQMGMVFKEGNLVGIGEPHLVLASLALEFRTRPKPLPFFHDGAGTVGAIKSQVFVKQFV